MMMTLRKKMTSFHLERNLPNMEKESQFKRKKKLLLDKVKYPKTRILKSSRVEETLSLKITIT